MPLRAIPPIACCLLGGCILNPFGGGSSSERPGDALNPPGNRLGAAPSDLAPAPVAGRPAEEPAAPAPAAPRPVLVTVDLSTPKSAAMTYYRAMSYGDAGAARAAVLGDDLTNHYIDATTAFSAAVRDLYTALSARFGRDAARSNPEFLAHLEDFASADVPRAIAVGEVHYSGDTATLTLQPVGAFPGNEGAPAVFKRDGGRWKLAMLASRRLDGLQAQEAVELTVDQRRSAERLSRLARNVRADRYATVEQVWAGEVPGRGTFAAAPPAPRSPVGATPPSPAVSAPRVSRPLASARPTVPEMPAQPAPDWTPPVRHPATPWPGSAPAGTTQGTTPRTTPGATASAGATQTRPPRPDTSPTEPDKSVAPAAPPAVASVPPVAPPEGAPPEKVRPETAPVEPSRPAVTDVTPPSLAAPSPAAPPAVVAEKPTTPPAPAAPAVAPREEVSSAVAAVRQAHLEMARSKLDKGADVNAKDARGRTMLHEAAIAGEDEVVKLLLSRGADVRLIDSQGWTALCWAASGGHTSIVKLLLDAGADPNLRDQIGATALHWAAIFDQKDAAALMIDHGADIKAQDLQGKTPLHAAAEHDATQTAALLISKGASLKAKDEDGHTPLHDVIQHAQVALADLAQMEPDAAATGGATPAAATSGVAASGAGAKDTRQSILKRSAEMIELLLASGADVNGRTPRGQTALHLAAWDDTKDLINLLLAKGADADAQDARGRTPLDIARQRGQKEAVRALGGQAE